MQILLSTADRLTMQLLLATLTDSGARLDVAETENEFVRKCLGGAYQLVITQFDAPFLNGYDLPDQLRRRRLPRPSFFLLSYVRSEEPLLSFYESGIEQVIPMPFDADRLRKKVAEKIKSRQ